MTFSEQVYEATQQIPRGRVTTYGQLAALLGKPNAARAVGNALHHNPYEGDVPCHRVVNSAGRLASAFAFGGANIQADLLADEGVPTQNNHIQDLPLYLWHP